MSKLLIGVVHLKPLPGSPRFAGNLESILDFAVPLGDFAIEDSAHDTLDRGLADALILSGTGTGVAADITDVERVRRACPKAKILLGSGVNAENAREFMRVADGAIVGSSLKRA